MDYKDIRHTAAKRLALNSGDCVSLMVFQFSLAALLVLFVEIFCAKISRSLRHKPEFQIELTYLEKPALDQIMRCCKDNSFAISNLQVTGSQDTDVPVFTAVISLRSRKYDSLDMLLPRIKATEGVLSAECVTV